MSEKSEKPIVSASESIRVSAIAALTNPGFIPTLEQILELGIEKLQVHRLERILGYRDNPMWGLTFQFSDGMVSPPKQTYP